MGLIGRIATRRRYRRMERLLAELDRAERRVVAPPRRVRQVSTWFTTAKLAAGFGLLVIVFASSFGWFPARGTAPVHRVPGGRVAVSSLPPLPADAASVRIMPPVRDTPTGPYAFRTLDPSGRPVTYDPCRPIHYVVNPAGMPKDGFELVRDAVGQISAATGLAFVEDGVTSEPLREARQPVQPERYGNRWAPVLIGWADEPEYPLLAGEVVGVGGSTIVTPSGPGSERAVTGQVALDRRDLAEILTEPDGDVQALATVMHELGHVVGLDHVGDPGELMAAEYTGQTGLGPGDREGLAAAGAGRCWTDT